MQGCITTLPNFQNIFPLNASNQAHKSSERESYRGSLDGINRYKPTTNAENLLLKAHALMCRREIPTAHASPCVSNGVCTLGGVYALRDKINITRVSGLNNLCKSHVLIACASKIGFGRLVDISI